MPQPIIPLDTCCQNILLLLAKAHSPLTANQIASELNITSRIVHYRLERVEHWLTDKNIVLIKKPGEGISLGIDETRRLELLKELSSMPVGSVFLIPTERLQIMILTFLFSDEPIVVKQLEKQLFVSRTTILKDLETIDKWLSARQLILTRRPNFGCVINGSETDIRSATVDALIESVGEAFSNHFEDVLNITENQYQKTETAFKHQLANYLSPLDLRFFYNLVNKIGEENNFALRESAHLLLVIYMAVVSFRLRFVRQAERDEKPADFSQMQRNHKIATQLTSAIQKRYQVQFSKMDMVELVDILHRSQEKISEFALHELSIAGIHEREQIKRDFDPDVINIVEQLLERASTYLHPSLRMDSELTLNLANHLTHLYKYPGSRLPIKNPLLAELKKEYPYIYKIAVDCTDIITQNGKFNLQEDEMGYIAMYLAAGLERMCIPLQNKKRVVVVCNAGGATASLLVSRIHSEFPDMEIVGVMSNRELTNKKDLLDYNLVICTIPLDVKDVPNIIVSPLLSREDVRRIQDLLHTQSNPVLLDEKNRHISGGQIHLADLIVAKTIRLNIEAIGWEDVVDKAGEPLLVLKAIEPRYITAMKDVIKRCGPYMVIWPGVVLLHARPDEGVNCLSMSLITLKNPVAFGTPGKDPVYIAIVLGAVNNNSHLNALFELNALMQKPLILDSLRNASSTFQIRSLLANL